MNACRLLGVGWVFASVLAGCGAAGESDALVNPASKYCVDAGYTLEIRRTEAGEIGVCHFGDGEQCEEWAFLHGGCGIQRTFCATQGYTPEPREGTLVCVFPGGTSCPELDHMNGTCLP
ncbi:MAG TPA: DUF333 domain-containing protein [Polyangiaceae bacterium]